jgi:antitoxin (DNA-binding transcriptional repressor) of toxin-antitoxin stability system
MKTATVRDLRNRFADVAKMIEEGESVAITRHGATFATLSPASAERSSAVNWAKRLATTPAVGRKATKAETDALWKALRA